MTAKFATSLRISQTTINMPRSLGSDVLLSWRMRVRGLAIKGTLFLLEISQGSLWRFFGV
jgi:hypothetical protein